MFNVGISEKLSTLRQILAPLILSAMQYCSRFSSVSVREIAHYILFLNFMAQHHDKRQYLIYIILRAPCRIFVSVLRYERDFILSLKSDAQSDIVEALNNIGLCI